MKRKRGARLKPKSHSSRTIPWLVTLIVIVVSYGSWRAYNNLYSVSPQFNYLHIIKDDQLLKLINGETVRLHPRNRIKILEISTNIYFNHGIRISSKGIDANAFLFEEIPVSELLPGEELLKKHIFRLEIKRHNQEIGYIHLEVEPYVEDWLDKADRIIDKKRKIDVLEDALKQMPDDKRIKERLLLEYRAVKNWQKVTEILEEKVKDNSDQDVLIELLEMYETISNANKIVSVLRRLITLNPKDPNIRLKLATFFEEKGKIEDAIKEYVELLNIAPDEDLLYIHKTIGFLYSKINKPGKAITYYLKASRIDQKDANLFYNLSSLYEQIGHKDKADYYLSKAVSLKSGDVDSRLVLAERLISKKKYTDAKKHLSAVLKIKPKSKQALLLMLNIAEKKGDKKNLKIYYKKLLAIEPSNKTVINNLAIIEYETDNLTNAALYFKKLVKINPKDKEVHSFLYDIYRKTKKNDLAYREAQILIKLKPKEAEYFYFSFEYLNKQKKYKDIIKIMKEGLKRFPKDADLREYLILAYLETGEEDRAMEQIKVSLKANPKNILLLMHLAKLQEKKATYYESANSYKRVLDLSPDRKEAKEGYLRTLLILAQFQEKTGKKKESLDSYKKILDIEPDNTKAEEAYLRLRFESLPK